MKNIEFNNAYNLTACFYYNNIKEVKKNQFPYRKYVDIIKKENSSEHKDIMFIMMNPGSAKRKIKLKYQNCHEWKNIMS